MQKWSVVACDQYTSEPEYWEEVEKKVGDNPSTLHLIFPEIYLEHGNADERIKRINNEMKRYINEGILVSQKPCMLLVDRSTPHTKSEKDSFWQWILKNTTTAQAPDPHQGNGGYGNRKASSKG